MPHPSSRRVRPSILRLEDRTNPAPLLLVVDTPNDVVNPSDGLTSLREAIDAAEASVGLNERAEIRFVPALTGADILVSQIEGFQFFDASAFEITSGQDIIIVGSGQKITRVPDPIEPFDMRLFGIGSAGRLELRDVEVVGGRATIGGGIYNEGSLSLDRCTVTSNVATGGIIIESFTGGQGGGIYNTFGTLTVVNSTITGNAALAFDAGSIILPSVGGGIVNENGTVALNDVTVADNTADRATQIYNSAAFGDATLAVNYSIISSAGSVVALPSLVSEAQGSGTAIATGIGNLIRGATGYTGSTVSSADPLLGPLQNNGGFTRTRALPFGSPAVDAGVPRGFSGGALIDQRGVDRPFGDANDLGAYEGVFLASLSGSVYVDADDDGVFDTGETPIPGVTITLTNGSLTLTTTTGSDGSYLFADLTPGTYAVTETQPAGFLDGRDTAGSFGGTVTNDRIADIVLPPAGNSVNNNFGELPLPPPPLPPLPPPLPPPPTPILVVGAGQGGGPHVKVFDPNTGAELASFYAFDPDFTGGVRVSQGDFNGDGIADIVTAAGPGGGPHVRVFDGATGAVILNFFAFDPEFVGGVYVAAGDVNDDGVADIITGAGLGGGPHVKVFDGATGAVILSFFAYDAAVDCGVTVGCNGSTIVTGTGFGHAPHVKAFNARTGQELLSFFAYDTSFTGVNVSVGPVGFSTDSRIPIFTGQGNGTPALKKFLSADTTPINFIAFDGVVGGATVASHTFNSDSSADFAVGAGAGGAPHVRVFDGIMGLELASFLAFDAGFSGGIFVG